MAPYIFYEFPALSIAAFWSILFLFYCILFYFIYYYCKYHTIPYQHTKYNPCTFWFRYLWYMSFKCSHFWTNWVRQLPLHRIIPNPNYNSSKGYRWQIKGMEMETFWKGLFLGHPVSVYMLNSLYDIGLLVYIQL